MSRAGKHRERFLKQFLKAELMVVRPGVIGIDGEIQLSLAQLIDHRQQLALHDPHLHLRMLLMKAADHRRHQRPGDAGAKANIDLPGLLSLTLQQFILRRPQLLKDQARMLIKTFAIVSQRHPLAAADEQLSGKPLLELFDRFGQGRLRDRQRAAGAANTPFPGHLDEGANLMKFDLKGHAFGDNRCLSDARK